VHRFTIGNRLSLHATRLLVACVASLAAGTTLAQELDLSPDVVELTSGRRIKGRVVFQDDEGVTMRIGSREKVYDREKVVSVEAITDKLPRALDLIDSLPYGSVGLHLDAAGELADLGLPREARLLYWRVLGFDPEERRAHEGLGSRRSSNRWLVPGGKRATTLEKLKVKSADWGGAWEFETTHFRLRSNLPLETALTACLDLERIYRGFYATFGAAFELHEVIEPMEVSIHADRSSYPELSSHLGGYFSPADNRLYMDASSGLERPLLAHEVTHQLLFNTAYRTRKRSGHIPGWLDEGLAQYMQAAARPLGESLAFRPGTEVPAWLSEHAVAQDPFTLKRVLNLDQTAFRGSESRLKYAQSWSLVQFCLHADDGLYRPGFLRYINGCYRGQSSGTHFTKAFKMDAEELELPWLKWVRGQANR
jgi:hypothetical protein